MAWYKEKPEQACYLLSLVQEVEILTANDQREKERLTWSLAKFISDLAVITEVQRHLGLSSCRDYYLLSWSDDDFSN